LVICSFELIRPRCATQLLTEFLNLSSVVGRSCGSTHIILNVNRRVAELRFLALDAGSNSEIYELLEWIDIPLVGRICMSVLQKILKHFLQRQ